MMDILECCKNLPKIELHAHINGSLSYHTLKTLNCSEENVKKYQTQSRTDLTQVFDLFKVAHDTTNNRKSIYFTTKSVIEDFYKDNTIYLELRTTPRASEDMTKEDYIESVIKAIQDNTNSTIVKLILSIDRRDAFETSKEALDLFIKMKKQFPEIIKGIDLSGDPTKGQFYKELFEEAAHNNLFTTIHCAEVKNDKEVMNILNFTPDRLGHGTFLHPNYGGSDNIWDLYKKKRIPLECCITSNVICNTSNYESHHVKEWIKNGLPFTLGTDDKGVFCTTLSEEYKKVSEYCLMTSTDLWNISYQSVDYTFASDKEKDDLRKQLEDWKKKNHSYF